MALIEGAIYQTLNDVNVEGHKKSPICGAFADRTGLEPATSCVTGRHSNQLNYRSFPSFEVIPSKQGCKDRFWRL